MLQVLLFVLGPLLVIAYLFLRISKSKNPFKLGMLFAEVHFFFVVMCAALVYLSIKQQSPDSHMWGWFFPFIIDIPTSYLMFTPFFKEFFHGDYMWENFYSFFLFFALLGSIQYFLIGIGLGWLRRKPKKFAA